MKLKPVVLCACGCGRLVNSGRYISQHHRRGKKFTDEHRERISTALEGKKRSEESKQKQSAAMKGKKHSEETKRKISAAGIGHEVSEETRRKLSKANKGRKHTEEQRRKNSEGHVGVGKGKKLTEEHKQKISVAMKGRKGRKHTEEQRRKMSKSHKGKPKSEAHRKKIGDVHRGKKVSERSRERMSESAMGRKHSEETLRKMSDGRRRGENHPNWLGEDHNRIYPEEFNQARKQILKRDGGKCLNPGCWGTSKRISVHHIDYDKDNNDLGNLITVCMSCNNRANKGREFWTAFYRKLMVAKLKPVLNEGAL